MLSRQSVVEDLSNALAARRHAAQPFAEPQHAYRALARAILYDATPDLVTPRNRNHVPAASKAA